MKNVFRKRVKQFTGDSKNWRLVVFLIISSGVFGRLFDVEKTENMPKETKKNRRIHSTTFRKQIFRSPLALKLGDNAVRKLYFARSPRGKIGIMRDKQQSRAPFRAKAQKHFHNFVGGRFVEIARRLVGENYARRIHYGSRNRDALFFSARHLRRQMPHPRF